jgi:hypothetical protein
MSSATPAEVRQHIAAVHAEAGGLLRLYFLTPEDGWRLMLGAAAGDAWATGMLTAVADCARAIKSAPKRKPSLCLCCPAPLRRPAGLMFCIAVPETGTPRHALGSAICPRCAGRPELESRAAVALRQVWPDLREIRPMPGPETMQ